jgi:Kef-type K+ transport system membrane component KefB
MRTDDSEHYDVAVIGGAPCSAATLKRSGAIYLLIITIAGLILLGLLHLGYGLTPIQTQPAVLASSAHGLAPEHASVESIWSGAKTALREHAREPVSRLFLQLLVIIGASRTAGWVFARFGQPAVIGEMAAGILLGPSLFGLIAPDAFQFVFPASSLGTLQLLSQIGVCLFMFAVGMDLDLLQMRRKAHTAILVSHASIIIPYVFGVALALLLYRDYAEAGASFTAFALFMGISMSITAFPVLARILQERNLSKTALGTTAISCAAIDDVTAWTVLAFVVAVVRATSIASAGFILLLAVLFVTLMLCVVKRQLPRWLGGRMALEQTEPGKGRLAAIILVVLVSSLATELIGIHALFGAFLAGLIMPSVGSFRHKLSVRVESVSSVLLLPLFFAFTGLRTQIGLLHDAHGWVICLSIIAVATVGKLGGSAVTARLTGMEWRESLQLGALMNTRGLMELIALNIGYDLGVLSPSIFTMLVVMALTTTAMTGPLLTIFGESWRIPGLFQSRCPANFVEKS